MLKEKDNAIVLKIKDSLIVVIMKI